MSGPKAKTASKKDPNKGQIMYKGKAVTMVKLYSRSQSIWNKMHTLSIVAIKDSASSSSPDLFVMENEEFLGWEQMKTLLKKTKNNLN